MYVKAGGTHVYITVQGDKYGNLFTSSVTCLLHVL